MNKTQYYNAKRQRFLTGRISVNEWKRFCFLFLITSKQWQKVCKRLKKLDSE